MLVASAREVFDRLALDPAEYLADLYCMDRAANILALRLLQQGHDLTPGGTGAATALCRELREVLHEAFRRAGVSQRTACINLDTGGEFGTQLRPFQLGDSPLKLPGEFATSINLVAGAVQQHHAASS